MRETLAALQELKMHTILLWPNADAGSDEISKEIRTFREVNKPDSWLHVFKNLPMEVYIPLMDLCACAIGNSSSPLREGAIIGVPTVNIGNRQTGRLMGKNVVSVGYNRQEIIAAAKQQLTQGKFPSEPLYGDGSAGKKIAHLLAEIDLTKISVQKKITY